MNFKFNIIKDDFSIADFLYFSLHLFVKNSISERERERERELVIQVKLFEQYAKVCFENIARLLGYNFQTNFRLDFRYKSIIA